jgi:nitrite reductase/ring-hydroxylating ferredoxin subunit
MRPELEAARYVIAIEDNATVVCEVHRAAFEYTLTAMHNEHAVYEMDPEEEPIVCQVCHLAYLNSGEQKTQH